MEIEKLAQLTINKHRESVVVVDKKATNPGEAGMCTGFIIRSTHTSCLVMTCQHMTEGFVASKHTLCIRFAGEATEYEAEILHEDDLADLAIIRVRGTRRKYPSLQFADAEDVPAETNVCLLGYIFTRQTVPTLDPGVCPGKTCAPPEFSGPGIKDVVFTSAGHDGVSGAPVMLSDKVIGVAYCCYMQLEHARSSETVNSALKSWLLIAPDAVRSTEEMIELLQL